MADMTYDIIGITPNGVELVLGSITGDEDYIIDTDVLLNWMSYNEEDLVELDDSAFRPAAFVALKVVKV
jgi:hypothetical protein